MLDLMMSYELDLAPVSKFEARRSAFIVGASTIFGSFIPLIPYLFVGKNILLGTEVSVIFSGVVLFGIGFTKRRLLWARSGEAVCRWQLSIDCRSCRILDRHFIGALPL